MKLRTCCDVAFDIATVTPFIFMLRPRSGAQQLVVNEAFTVVPEVRVRQFTDTFGNLCQRVLAPVGRFSIHASATVRTADIMDRDEGAPFVEVQNLPDEVLQFLLPSRYCEVEHFGRLATEISENQVPGHDQVAAIEAWLRSEIRYSYGNSDSVASACEVHARKSGVCRDLAHLGIALCRSLAIPARIVAGYLHDLEPMDLHAWFEAYVGDRWYAFDATQPQPTGGYVVLGIGRDAADVAVYNQFGPPIIPVSRQIRVEQVFANSP